MADQIPVSPRDGANLASYDRQAEQLRQPPVICQPTVIQNLQEYVEHRAYLLVNSIAVSIASDEMGIR